MKYILFIILVLMISLYEYKKHIYLIENGNIIFKNLTEAYDLEALIKDLIKNKVYNIEDVEKAYNLFGSLKIVSKKPYILISNGKIDYENLFKTKKTIKFIYETLYKKKIKLNEVLYAIYLNDKFYIVKN